MRSVYALVLSIIIAIFIGCGSGGGGGSSVSSTQSSEAVQEQVNSVIDKNAFIETNATNEAIDVNETAVSLENDGSILVKKAFDESDRDRALFIDGVFQGIVDEVEQIDENSTKYRLKDAQSIEEVYSNFTVDFSTTDNLQRSIRSLNNRRIRGLYDDINPKNPITTYFFSKKSKLRNGKTQEDLYLHIGIPKNYKFPIGDHIVKRNIRGKDTYVSCTFDRGACVIAAAGSVENNISLSTSTTLEPSFVITTEGSYLEYKIAGSINFTYRNQEFLNNQPEVMYNFEVDAEMDLNLNFEVNGEASAEIVNEYNITKGFSLEIIHPLSGVAKTSIKFQPKIEFGASAKIEGKVSATSRVRRKLELKIDYHANTEDPDCNPKIDERLCKVVNDLNKYVKYENEPYNLTEASLNVDIEAEAQAWATPNIYIAPEVKAFRVTNPIYLGNINGGSTLKGIIDGKIGASYILNNEGGTYNSYAEVGINVFYQFFIDAQFYVKIGSREFLKTEKKSWYKSDPKEIFDWRIRVLHKPEIKVTDKGADVYGVSFATDIVEEDIASKIKFYYTTDGSKPTYSDEKNFHGTLWDGSEIDIMSTSTIKVIAVLRNRDISDSIWAFGISVSDIAKEGIKTEEKNPDCEGSMKFEPSSCYSPNDTGCWKKSCIVEKTCPNERDTALLTTWSKLYQPHTQTNDLTLDFSLTNQIIQQPVNSWGTCTQRVESWRESGTLSYATDYQIFQNSDGCWYANGRLCTDWCYTNKSCAATIEMPSSSSSSSLYSISSSSSSSEMASSSSEMVSSSSSSLIIMSSSSSSSSSSQSYSSTGAEITPYPEVYNPHGYSGVKVFVSTPFQLDMNTEAQLDTRYSKIDYDNNIFIEYYYITAECTYTIVSGSDIIDIRAEGDKLIVIGKKTGTAIIHVEVPQHYIDETDEKEQPQDITVNVTI